MTEDLLDSMLCAALDACQEKDDLVYVLSTNA